MNTVSTVGRPDIRGERDVVCRGSWVRRRGVAPRELREVGEGGKRVKKRWRRGWRERAREI